MSASPTAPVPRIEVHLAIDQNSRPITGELRVGDAQPRRFWSWLDLIAALDAANRGEEK